FSVSAQSLAFVLNQQAGGLTYYAEFDNFFGAGAKWLLAAAGATCYFLTSDGTLTQWDGSGAAGRAAAVPLGQGAVREEESCDVSTGRGRGPAAFDEPDILLEAAERALGLLELRGPQGLSDFSPAPAKADLEAAGRGVDFEPGHRGNLRALNFRPPARFGTSDANPTSPRRAPQMPSTRRPGKKKGLTGFRRESFRYSSAGDRT